MPGEIAAKGILAGRLENAICISLYRSLMKRVEIKGNLKRTQHTDVCWKPPVQGRGESISGNGAFRVKNSHVSHCVDTGIRAAAANQQNFLARGGSKRIFQLASDCFRILLPSETAVGCSLISDY